MTEQRVVCEMCRIGRCQPTKAPFIYWVADQVLVSPDAPASACDICGQLYFEPVFLSRMEHLLQELENSINANKTVIRERPAEHLVNFQPTRGS